MSLPKEPRQKMINIMYLVLTALLALNVSAEILNAFKTVNGSLQSSNDVLESGNKNLIADLNAKKSLPESKEKAAKYEPMAAKAKDYADQVYNQIEDWKQSLLKSSGFDPAKKGDSSFNESDLEAPTRLFIEEGNGKKLHDALDNLKKNLLGIDPEIQKEFASKLPINLEPPKSQAGNTHNEWDYSYFHMTPTIAALTILSKFQNDVKNSENQIVTWCDNQIGAVAVRMDKVHTFLNSSSDYVMPGTQVTLTAGVGAFSSAASPTITMLGKTVQATDGYIQTTVTASGTGQQTVPVHIAYKDQDGNPVSIDDKISYTVGVPSGAAIMLDKMNVFYIGVENPIHISSSTGWDRTTVTSSGCTVTGQGSERIVKVSAPGAASITVTADGKSNKFDFRVKRIPDPVFKVGPSNGGAISASIFKNQQFCRAELENFDFAAGFQVISATVYFTGTNFNPVQIANLNGNSIGNLSQMSRCAPGTSVIFDNVKVKGPDGTERTISAPGFILK